MDKIVIYIHGQGGNAREADHYRPLFPDHTVIGFDYTSQSPREAKEEFPVFFDAVGGEHAAVTVIANSIGAYFTMTALSDRPIEKAYFISPIVDMETLIEDSMKEAHVSEEELREKGVIELPGRQALSWEYLSYVRQHPVRWNVPTHVLYGKNDTLTSVATVSRFISQHADTTLTVLENGEHWFHTEEQMAFLDRWIRSFL